MPIVAVAKRLTTIVVVATAVTSCPLSGQTGGIPSGAGHVPVVECLHRAVAAPNAVIIDELLPGAPAALVFSPTTNVVPLGAIGLGPAEIVPDPHAPGGGLVFGLVANPAGSAFIPFTVPPSMIGATLWMQAISQDGLAPWNGISLSHGTPFIFGRRRDTFAALEYALPGFVDLVRVFDDGTPAAPPLTGFTGLLPQPLTLTQRTELAGARNDRAVVDDLAFSAAVIRLPDGSMLASFRAPGSVDLLCRITRDGGIEELVRAAGLPTEPAFDAAVAVSANEPFAAVVADNPLPEYGGATVLLLRIDGLSHEGSHLRVRGVPHPPGLMPESTSLAFLDGALFFGDGESVLLRHDIAAGTTVPVVFPSSGGVTPVYVDESCAVAEDGSALAIGAGIDEDNHDVYVVDAQGTATNLTGLPGDYEDSGPGQAAGGQLAIAPDGGRVAYMRTALETEAFVRDAAPGAAEIHLTPPTSFIDSIDTVTGFGFATGPAVFMTAGKDLNTSDVYRQDAGGVINVTATSGDLTAPYGLGATLLPQRRFTHDRGHFMVSTTTTGPVLSAYDDAGVSLLRPLGALDVLIGVDRALLAVSTAAGVVTADTIASHGTPALVQSWTSSPANAVVASARRFRGAAAAFMLRDGTVVVTSKTGALTPHAGPHALVLGGSLAFDHGGELVASITTTAGTELWRLTTRRRWVRLSAAATRLEFLR